MKPLWRRALVPLLVLLGVNAVLFGAYTLPWLLRERSASARAKALEKDVEAKLQETAAARERADAITANTSEMNQFFAKWVTLPRLSILSLLAEIEQQAVRHNLKVGNRSYTFMPVKGLPIGRFTASMPINGSYAHLAEFLRSLETSRYFVTVDSIAIREQKSGNADLTMALSGYYRQGGEVAEP